MPRAPLLKRISPLLAALMVAAGSLMPARAEWKTSKIKGSPRQPAPYTLNRVQPKLRFENPVDLETMPGSDRLFVVQQNGLILSFHTGVATSAADVAVDLRKLHQPFDNCLAITFHPKFSENRFVYVCYNEPGNTPDGAHVSRFTVSNTEPPVIVASSEQKIIRWMSGGHNGCALKFGPDGLLYISTGDTASPTPPDPLGTGQDISDLLASILRIDVDHPSVTAAYSIPKDNPFTSTSGARPEVYAYGFRNPWRMHFNHKTGELFVGDVGWELWEMIYRVKSGGNYGWSITEGPQPVYPNAKRGPTPIQSALATHSHTEAASITGGLFYRGKRLPKLEDAYIYGDWETGKIWGLRNDGDTVTWKAELLDSTIRVVAFGEDHQQEMLILDYNGGIYELAENHEPDLHKDFPKLLSQTGLFSDAARQTPSPGVVHYEINASMWSDYATAERWVAIPSSQSITNGEKWITPKDTVFVKTLSMEMESGKADSKKKLETQILHFDGQTWNAYSYRWNDAETDARLVEEAGENMDLKVVDPTAPGGMRLQTWRFSSSTECLRCHNPWAGNAIAFNFEQLNRASQLEYLTQSGIFNKPPEAGSIPKLASANDATASVEQRARIWLHVNCAHCHRLGAGGAAEMFLSKELSNTALHAIDEKPLRGEFAINGAAIIASGDPYRSVLFYRINTEGQGHMPHIGSRLADKQGIRLIHDWINSSPKSTNQPTSAMMDGSRATAEVKAQIASFKSAPDVSTASKLAATTSGALALLQELDQPTLSATARQLVIDAAVKSPNALASSLLERHMPQSMRRKTLGASFAPQEILQLKGNAASGKKQFLAEQGPQCARCHQVDGEGRAYGPDLSKIGRKYNREQLLDQILNPSKIIAPEYSIHQFELKDGTEYTGLIIRQTPAEITLRLETLQEVSFAVTKVARTQTSQLSVMPEGLLQNMTPQEAADLLEFLSTR